MPAYLFNETGLVFLAILCGTLLFLYLQLRARYKKLQNDLTQSSLNKVTQKSKEIIVNAIRRAQNILTEAEEESLDLVATGKKSAKSITEKYENELSSLTKKLEQELEEEIKNAEAGYTDYLSTLKNRSATFETAIEKHIKLNVDTTFKNFEKNLSDLILQTQARSALSIEQELKTARTAIQDYKTQQMKLVDENVVSMLEKTLSLVLAKKLTLREHIDLVYESLEKAKVEKIIS